MNNFDCNTKINPVYYPCWLSSEQLEQAQYLIDLGYEYIGTDENIDFVDCGNDEEELTLMLQRSKTS